MNTRIRVLEPEEFYLIEPLLDPAAPPLDPDYSRVIVSIDIDSEKVVGLVALQLVLHSEPIIISPEYRGQGAWRELAEWADDYIATLGVQAVYNQPTHEAAEHIAQEVGYVKAQYPLYVKYYSEPVAPKEE